MAETMFIVKGGGEELDLFYKAEKYYNSITPKWYEFKDNNTFELTLRHPEKSDGFSIEDKKEYEIDDILKTLEKHRQRQYNKQKDYSNPQYKDEFWSAYADYIAEKDSKIILSEGENIPKEDFSQEKQEYVILNEYDKFRSSFGKSINETIVNIYSSKKDAEAVLSEGERVVNVLDLTEEQREYLKEKSNRDTNKQMIGGTVREIAGKSLADKNYLYLFDKGTKNTIDAYLKTQPNLEPIELTSKDYLAISNVFEKEKHLGIELNSEEREKIVSLYYELYQAKEKQELKQTQNLQNMEALTPQEKVNEIFNEIQEKFNPKQKAYLELAMIDDMKGSHNMLKYINEVRGLLNGEESTNVHQYMNELRQKHDTINPEGKWWDNPIYEKLLDKIVVKMETSDEFLKDVNPIFGDIMTKKHNESEKQIKYKAESITEFYKNYVIDPTKALSHNDIYAFINQSGSNHLKEMLANQYPNITFPDKLNEASILEHIVKPIRNLNEDEIKNFKAQLEARAKNSIKEAQVKESTPNQEQKDWNKYYMDIRKNIKTEYPVSHTDIYALINANHIPAEKKEEIVKEFVPTLSLDLSKPHSKSKLLQEIVYPLRETNKSEAFKDALKQLYTEFPEQVSSQSIEQKTEPSTNKQQSISEFYTKYLLDYDATKNITHIPIYAYVNLPISDTEKMETLNNLARDLGRETEFVITPEELHKLSKNKVLKELVYPLRENSQSLEEVFKHQIQTSFIQSRENTQNYNIVLDNLQIDLDKTDKINIDIVNKILHEKNITISDLAENFNLNIASSSDTNLKIDFIREINKDAEKVENILHQLQNTNIKQNKL